MEPAVAQFVLLYLLLPILGLIIGVVTLFIAKKNKLLDNKKAIFYFLLCWVVLALPALLGFIDYWFMPYVYILLQITYFFLGWWNMKLMHGFIKDLDDKPFYVEFLLTFLSLFIGMALFSLVFNLCNELQYGLWASTCLIPFIFPLVFRKAYTSFLAIPLEVYNVWRYENAPDFDADLINLNEVLVVELEMFKQAGERKAQNIKAKAPENMPFGAWFKVFIDDYNKRTPQSPIAYSDYEDSYGWIFYINSAILGRKKHIDPDKTFSENKIKEENVIIAKRSQYKEYE